MVVENLEGLAFVDTIMIDSKAANRLADDRKRASRGCAVRLTDGENKELYRTPLDPIPTWATARPSA